ncbi:MAG: hypothetical protein COA69_00050 [Robiginitomaculum sp.]|nr:MAG: hypothetical protein COA69_00050 [Robiginitomaculum sp.]
MRKGKPPYYQVRNGRAYFELGKNRACTVGMNSTYPLGRAGWQAEAQAFSLYYEWLEKSGRPVPDEAPKAYKRGTLGHWYQKFKQTGLWGRKSVATRKEWEYYWPFIDAGLGDKMLNKVSPSDFEEFHIATEKEHGSNARWRIVKIARALFNAAIKYHLIGQSPCMVLPNTKPQPRNQIWFATEVAYMADTAKEMGFTAMHLSIRLAWESLMSPVDVRTLKVEALHKTHQGYHIETERKKTGKEVFAALSDGLGDDLHAYIDGLSFTLLPNQAIFRNRRDNAAYLKARFNSDFRAVRAMAFGKEEKRFLMDIRRSGNVEADLGGASAEDRAEILANALHKDQYLENTYTPPTVAKARKVAKQRAKGREILAAQSLNTPRHSLK